MALVFQAPVLERWRRWGVGSRQRMNSYWDDIARKDPTFSTVYLTVELVFGGDVVVRFARGPIRTVSSLDGTVYEYQQGLLEEPDVDHVLDLKNRSASARSLNFTVPASIVGASDILLRGGMLAGVGEVSLQVAGGDYELRYVLLRGDMGGGVVMGGDAEGVQIQLSDPRATQSLQVPETSVDLDRWPLALDAAVGCRYPLVLNGYQKVPCQRVLNDHGVTGLKFLVCAPGRDLQVDATYVNGEVAAGVYLPATETADTDGLGTPCKTFDFSASAGPWADTDTVYADLSRVSGVAALSVVQVVRKLLEGYTALGRLGLNPDLFSEADLVMPQYPPSILVNASGEDAVDVQDFVENTLLGSFPMVYMTYAGAGLGPVVVDRRVSPDLGGLRGRLVGKQFPLIDRLSWGQETAKEDLYNSFELRYGFDAMQNTYGAVVKRDSTNSVACALSERMVGGQRPMTPIESPFITTEAMANYVIDWLVAHLALPAYYLEWSCTSSTILRYRLGQNVMYYDPDISAFQNKVATVTRLCYSRGQPVIGLTVWSPAWSLLLLGKA